MLNKSSSLVVACLAGLAASASAQVTNVSLQVVVPSGLARPLFVNAPANDARLFIVEQRGFQAVSNRAGIRIYSGGALLPNPYFVLNGVTTGSEQGLLGFAFHPRYTEAPQYRYFWINYTNSSGTTVIARGRVDPNNPDQYDPTFGTAGLQTLFTIAQPFTNHNGGWVEFGPDGYLYISTGDGGSANDPQGNGQNMNTALGKLLRIDVDGPDNIPGNADDADPTNPTGRPYHRIPNNNPFVGLTGSFVTSIWAYGLRNPWRNSFDRLTGDLWIADVGQNAREEVNYEAASDRLNLQRGQPGYAGGRNYGWVPFEGTLATGLGSLQFPPPASGLPQARVDPILQYPHSGILPPTNEVGCSITGGSVYRGCAIPSMQGWYIFGDYCNGWVGAYNRQTGAYQRLFATGLLITSFGEDAYGEIYVVTGGSSGTVRKIVPTPGSFPDCNSNGQRDSCDILRRVSNDLNANALPDECEGCEQDINQDGVVDFNDFLDYLNLFNAANPRADINLDGVVDFNDLLEFLNLFNGPCT
ncbi:MAG: hypothetical protein FJ255_11160 [Phycisphaerae bacterium]|nr:hypothetical protein [Phycisphaerae bacterium]